MIRSLVLAVTGAALLVSFGAPGAAQTARARITEPVDAGRLQPLPGNVHPLARSEFDNGAAPPDLPLDHMLLVLTPSAERQQSLAQYLSALQDPASPQYHKWLTPQQFGQNFGVADADIAKVTAWLASYGFQIRSIANSKTVIEFSGTAGQLTQAFHTEMHEYRAGGVSHWANASDPQIPAALAPVVAGVSTLHNFRKAPQIARLQAQVARLNGGDSSGPKFTVNSGEYALAPADFATIYNINPVYQRSINGSGATIAVVARSNIRLQDIVDFRNAFGLSANTPQVVLNGTDPGRVSGDEDEAVLDTSWSGAIAPSAAVKLVVSASTNTTDGVDLSEEYIIDNNLADVMTESYGDCEANYTQAEAQMYSSLASQAAAQGITYTVASGDSGAEGCDDPGSETVATGPVSVSVLAATPYDTAVGGTMFNENGNYAAYWGSSNGAGDLSALTYIPENVWNESCLAAACGASNASIYAGSGGASTIFPKPSWQAGVAGIPNDGVRDVPDISMTSASHDFYLLCLDGSCTQRRGGGYFSGISGTSAATPSFAGIMGLLVQYTGSRQGLVNSKLYRLAAGETLALCNASNVSTLPAPACIFNDVTSGNNAVPGQLNYGSSLALYQATAGYDLATGLGSVNVNNLFVAWAGGSSGAGATTRIQAGIDAPGAQNATLLGLANFSGWALANTGAIQSVNVQIDSAPEGNAVYGSPRTDICATYSSSNCPNVGWTFSFDTTQLANGSHVLSILVESASGQSYSTSTTFNVANWTSANPMITSIDTPGTNSGPFSGVAAFGGWAIDSQSAISQVAVAIDGVSYGLATYGFTRNDVCANYAGYAGCPNVGWNLAIDTSPLADGVHTLAITPVTAGGQHSTTAVNFSVLNLPGNKMTLSIDQPGTQSGPFSGNVSFGGWSIATAIPVAEIDVTIDGVSYGKAAYGGNRSDVCSVYTGYPACPDVGWNFAFDSTQLPNGLHTLGLKAVTATSQYITATRTFTTANPVNSSPVSIGIDLPDSQNDILLGTVNFAGWSISHNPVSSVAIAIDGVPNGVANYGIARTDVCTVFPGEPNCPKVGWSYTVDTTQLADGVHTMTVTATADAASARSIGTLSSSFTVANWTTSNPMKLSIDTPSSQSGPLSGAVNIGGWAIDQLTAISKINVAVDGTPLGSASYGGVRADVCAVFSTAAGCPNVGWNYFLDTTLLSDGTHTLAITGITTAGQSSTFTQSFTVANSSTDPVLVSIGSPSTSQTLSGVTAIGGWALDTSGAALVSVDVFIDGEINGVATYGGSRPDVCAAHSGAAGCPDVGWNYLLDTFLFANGSHTLEVRARAADGHAYTAGTLFNIGNQP